MTERVLFMSNGHGEDAIAGRLIDALEAHGLPREQMAGWAIVGHGAAYEARGIARIGPANLLPSEGFGTLGLRPFLRDLRAGWIGTHLAQARFARALRGQFRLLVAVGGGGAAWICPGTAAARPVNAITAARQKERSFGVTMTPRSWFSLARHGNHSPVTSKLMVERGRQAANRRSI